MTHELKILPKYFEPVVYDKKTFEIRKNDRDYHVGDKLILREWDPETGYSGNQVVRYVSYILFNWENAIGEEYCIMSLKHTPPTVVPEGELNEQSDY